MGDGAVGTQGEENQNIITNIIFYYLFIISVLFIKRKQNKIIKRWPASNKTANGRYGFMDSWVHGMDGRTEGDRPADGPHGAPIKWQHIDTEQSPSGTHHIYTHDTRSNLLLLWVHGALTHIDFSLCVGEERLFCTCASECLGILLSSRYRDSIPIPRA